MKKDRKICRFCHHNIEDHDNENDLFYVCGAPVTDGQSNVGCYCRGFEERTEAHRKEEKEASEKEYLARCKDNPETSPSIWSRILDFIFRV